MSKQIVNRTMLLATVVFLVVASTGCGKTGSVTQSVSATLPADNVTTETAAPEITATSQPVNDSNILYQDNFTNPNTGWSEEKFDNFFIGYHEPEYYHIAISSPNYKTTVFIPEKPQFTDVTIEAKAFTFAGKTAESGDFRFGVAFRRSGDQYYAFTISQRTKTWAVLKSTGNGIIVLKEGNAANINDFDTADMLRVDAKGSSFFFHVNDQFIAQVDDDEYAAGEVGFFVQSLDAANLHIHYDSIVVKNVETSGDALASDSQAALLYADDFTKPTTGWLEKKFDNYFIGYHEPEYYHVAISSPNYKTTVFIPDKPQFTDVSIEVKAFTFGGKTADSGDFRFGIAFRRSGDNYYAFTISQRTKTWAILKSTPNELIILKEGTNEKINDFDVADTLRVDAKGSTFFFHINDDFIAQFDDADYGAGEVGFFVQTLDASNLHIHYDSITVTEFDPRLVCTITAMQINLRSGPGTSFASVTFLSKGATVSPTGLSPDGKWIFVNVPDLDQQGWIANVPQYVSCNSTLDVLPTKSP